jgi:hypothetical protein
VRSAWGGRGGGREEQRGAADEGGHGGRHMRPAPQERLDGGDSGGYHTVRSYGSKPLEARIARRSASCSSSASTMK